MKDKEKSLLLKISGIIGAFILMVISSILLLFNINSSDETRIDPQNNSNQTTEIVFINSEGNQIKLKAIIADSDQERAYGLMNRTSLDFNTGMLFIFDDESQRAFWMKNTYIPLDIIFLDSSKRIVKIHKNAKPLDETIRYPSEKPAKYVIEVNGGWSEINKIEQGSIVYF